MENTSDTKSFFVQKGHFFYIKKSQFSKKKQQLRDLEQNGQRHKKDNSKVCLKAI